MTQSLKTGALFINRKQGQRLDFKIRIAAWLVIAFTVFSLLYNLTTSPIAVETSMIAMLTVNLLMIACAIGTLYRQPGAYGVLLTLVIIGFIIAVVAVSAPHPGWYARFIVTFWFVVGVLLILGVSLPARAEENRDDLDDTDGG